MLKSYKETEQLYPTALSFAVHHALQKETLCADGNKSTQEKQIADALISKAKTGNITAINLVIKLNDIYKKRASYLDSLEEMSRAENGGPLPTELLTAMDAFERNLSLVKQYYSCDILTGKVQKYGEALLNSENSKDITGLKEDMEKYKKYLDKAFIEDFIKNLKVPYYSVAAKKIRKSILDFEAKPSKTQKEKDKSIIDTMDLEMYDAFIKNIFPFTSIYLEPNEDSIEDKKSIKVSDIEEAASAQNSAEQSYLSQTPSVPQETTVPAVDSSQENSAEAPASAEVAPQVEPQLATEPAPEIPDDLPELSDYATIEEVCDFFYKLTKDAAFLNPPKTRTGVQDLQDKLREPAIDRICSSLKGDNRFKCNLATDRLFDLVKEMEEYEVEQEEKIGRAKAATFGRCG